jgi:hypothetical protein
LSVCTERKQERDAVVLYIDRKECRPKVLAQGIGWVGFSVGLLKGSFVGVVTYCGVLDAEQPFSLS